MSPDNCRELVEKLLKTRRQLPHPDMALDDMFAKAELLIDQVQRR